MRRTWQGSSVTSGPKKERERGDVNTLAFDIVRKATEPETAEAKPEAPPKNQAAVEMGRKGGRRGGKRRAQRMTPEQRSEAAKLAAEARWKKGD
jgi:hypothetical protein